MQTSRHERERWRLRQGGWDGNIGLPQNKTMFSMRSPWVITAGLSLA